MNPKLEVLTPQNCQLIFIDHQPQMAFGVQSIDRQVLKNNTVGLAKAAKIFNIPTTITTVESQSFSGYTYPELLDGSRGKDKSRAAVRLEDLAPLLQLLPALKSAHAAGSTPTKAEFDALVDDVAMIHLRLKAVVEVLPCMREPTMAPLHGDQGFALKAAVPRADLPRVIPEIKARGGTDIVVTALAQIVP